MMKKFKECDGIKTGSSKLKTSETRLITVKSIEEVDDYFNKRKSILYQLPPKDNDVTFKSKIIIE